MGVILGILLFLGIGAFIYFGWFIGAKKAENKTTILKEIGERAEREKRAFNDKHVGWNSKPATEEETKEYNQKMENLKKELEETNKKYKNIISPILYVLGVVCLVAFIFVPFSFNQIDTGEVAVVKVWGEAKEVKSEGLNFDLWLSTKYVKYDLKTQEIKSEISAYSQDAQSMTASLTVQFRIQADKVLDINKQYGTLDVLTERIRAIAEEKAKVILSESSAMTLIETRSGLSSKVEEAIKSAVGQYHIDVNMVAVTDITFSEAFENTVEDKMIAEQEKLKAEYEKEKAIIQAEQALEVAKLEAEAKLAEAEGEAKAVQELAKAQANAIKAKSIEVARMLGFTITETTVDGGVEYEIDFTGKTDEEIKVISDYLKYVEYLEVWNGELPDVVTGDGVSIMIPTP